MGDCFHWWNVVFLSSWGSGIHGPSLSGRATYSLTPNEQFWPYKDMGSGGGKAWRWVYYLACLEVCWRWENVNFSFPICSNWAVMEPSCNLVFVSTKHALSRSHVPSAASTALVPQQFLACWWSPLVYLASAVSKNLWTSCPFFPQHLPVTHTTHGHNGCLCTLPVAQFWRRCK